MPINKQSVLLGLDDAKLFPLTADNTSTLSYGSPINVPGLQNINLVHNLTEKDLRSDENIYDEYNKLDSILWSFNEAEINLDLLSILEGGSVTSSGTTPNQSNIYTVNKLSSPAYFKLEAQIKYSSNTIGDFHLVLLKCKANSIQVSFQNQNYAVVSAVGVAIPTIYTGEIKKYVINETAQPII